MFPSNATSLVSSERALCCRRSWDPVGSEFLSKVLMCVFACGVTAPGFGAAVNVEVGVWGVGCGALVCHVAAEVVFNTSCISRTSGTAQKLCGCTG